MTCLEEISSLIFQVLNVSLLCDLREISFHLRLLHLVEWLGDFILQLNQFVDAFLDYFEKVFPSKLWWRIRKNSELLQNTSALDII